jgi:hypothetical protein
LVRAAVQAENRVTLTPALSHPIGEGESTSVGLRIGGFFRNGDGDSGMCRLKAETQTCRREI